MEQSQHQLILIFNVKTLRRITGLSQTRLAKLIGRTRNAIRHIEEQGCISNRDLLAIANIFGIEKPGILLQNKLEIKLGGQELKL